MVQRLIDADQPTQPLMLHRYVARRYAKSLGAIDDEMDRKIDKGDKPEFRRDEQDQQGRYRKVDEAVRQQGQRPAGLLILAERHPGVLQEKIRDDMLEGEDEHPPDQRADRDR